MSLAMCQQWVAEGGVGGGLLCHAAICMASLLLFLLFIDKLVTATDLVPLILDVYLDNCCFKSLLVWQLWSSLQLPPLSGAVQGAVLLSFLVLPADCRQYNIWPWGLPEVWHAKECYTWTKHQQQWSAMWASLYYKHCGQQQYVAVLSAFCRWALEDSHNVAGMGFASAASGNTQQRFLQF
jgi:hypothetical protein